MGKKYLLIVGLVACIAMLTLASEEKSTGCWGLFGKSGCRKSSKLYDAQGKWIPPPKLNRREIVALDQRKYGNGGSAAGFFAGVAIGALAD